MTKELWLNLPVKDIQRSRDFFTSIGWKFNDNFGNSAESTCLMVGEKQIAVMLFVEQSFQNFARVPIADVPNTSEILISFDLSSREEVDEMAAKVKAAGGTIFGDPVEMQGWMYGFAFIDLDGHRWNGLFMDMSKLPAK